MRLPYGVRCHTAAVVRSCVAAHGPVRARLPAGARTSMAAHGPVRAWVLAGAAWLRGHAVACAHVVHHTAACSCAAHGAACVWRRHLCHMGMGRSHMGCSGIEWVSPYGLAGAWRHARSGLAVL